MAHNGNLVNYYDLSRRLSEELHLQLLTNNDLEIFISLWCHYLQSKGIPHKADLKFADAIEATRHIFEQVDGGYACVGLMAEQGLFAFRDPNGIRPLVLGQKEDSQGRVFYCVASETASLQFLGYTFLRDIRPGELIFIESNGKLHSADVLKSRNLPPVCLNGFTFQGLKAAWTTVPSMGHGLTSAVCLPKKCDRPSQRVKLRLTSSVQCQTHHGQPRSHWRKHWDPYREAFIKIDMYSGAFILNSQEAREKAVQLETKPHSF